MDNKNRLKSFQLEPNTHSKLKKRAKKNNKILYAYGSELIEKGMKFEDMNKNDNQSRHSQGN